MADRITEKEGPHLVAGRLGGTAFDHLRGAHPPGTVPPPATWTGPPAHRSVMCGTAQVNWCMWTSRNWAKYPEEVGGVC